VQNHSEHYFEKVFDLTKLIPPGRVTTYGAIADYLSLGSARMVGWALNKSFNSTEVVPAHRVVNRKGELSGRLAFPGATMMQELLQSEGVEVSENKVVNFNFVFWNPMDHLI
jgi:methylated-DNA-protein-cysteine methyltransferase related protein